jgi:hypothetical protein
VCETGGARRTWLQGLEKVAKRYLLQVAARNLGLMLRKLFGIGTARSLQDRAGLFWFAYFAIEVIWAPSWLSRAARRTTHMIGRIDDVAAPILALHAK